MIAARFEHARIDALINRIQERGGNLTQPLSACGEIMLTSIDRNFEVQGRYSSAGDLRGGSTRWQPLAPATVAARLGGSKAYRKNGTLRKSAQRRLSGMRILQASGAGSLRYTFTKKVSGSAVTVGSNRIDAAKHNYGGYGGRGKTVYEPPRPILVVQDEDVEEMMDILGGWVNG